MFHPLIVMTGLAGLTIAAGCAVSTFVAVLVWGVRRQAHAPRRLPPVTILKPLCGAEPELYEHLRSFCRQDYPEFQVVFGVRDPADPARAVAERIAAEFPWLPIDVVVDGAQYGSNLKISNLINMLARARHDMLVIADSDTFVGPDYLVAVTTPLLDRGVGIVTCLYRGVPDRRIWSRLGAMYINEWYVPAVLLAWLFGYQGYVSGQTLCLRRDTLEAIGGLPAIANHLADDHRLGELVRGLGLRVLLSPYMVRAEHDEPNWRSLIRHELRWMCTLRVLRPRSFPWMFLSFSLPVAMLGIVLVAVETPLSAPAWFLFGATVVTRIGLHFVHRIRGERPLIHDWWLLPLRDLLTCWVWCRSLFISRITWRGHDFEVGPDGVMRRPS